MKGGVAWIHDERRGEEDEEQFFDSREDISSAESDSWPGSPPAVDRDAGDCLFGVWVQSPGSVRERREKFLKWMGLGRSPSSESDEETTVTEVDRIVADGGAVLSDSGSESASEDMVFEENIGYRIKNLDDGREFVADVFGENGDLRSLREVGSDRMMTLDEFERNFSASEFVQRLMRRGESSGSSLEENVVAVEGRRRRNRNGRRIGWLKRLGAVACIVDRQGKESNLNVCDRIQRIQRVQRIKVRSYRKRLKEFSSVYMRQDISAHDGAILTMKFCLDGRYLATGGEDGVVRVWRVTECELKNALDVPEYDPSCVYFKANRNSELAHLYADKEKKNKPRSLKRTSDSACVVIPSDVFQISEKPLHEFRGHDGDVLDLSWSKNKYLLSSSIDKTVRLWQVGFNSCLKVFSHNNYVTCIQFNPTDENYFISGSIDGKIRIWEIPRCRVVHWADAKEIVTAVCYQPDGKGGIVGTITGDCHFYDASDNQLQLDAKVSLQCKKKSVDKRITGFQFCPSDHQKLMVTSADSQVRILDGVDIVSKYKGFRNTGSQISASFTSDGRHIISASEDSNVYIWTHNIQDAPTSNQVKSTWSYERFFSSNASVALPWPGFESTSPVSAASEVFPGTFSDQTRIAERDFSGNNALYVSPTGSFTLSHDFFSEFLPKGSATWPEEKLPSGSRTASLLCKNQYKFLKTSCQNSSHAWGKVVVTGGWDGRIRSFQNYGLPVHL
ncbi:hypothetical protein J5N97_019067 [Dioscorea zingiberensis]|uniref:WD repeat-containing protein 44 n=1 Tax=Dioscorea zingiberensis TaxID=325984 RepID=A0A9D5CE77_9LILI|nr:hypothetical protein J5N97_019067 [Dioscorea zingiberensis]